MHRVQPSNVMTWSSARATLQKQGLAIHALLGAVAGILLLHPITKSIYSPGLQLPASVLEAFRTAFDPRMLPMTAAFAIVGGALGLGFGLYHRLLARHTRVVGFLEAELARSVASIVATGESEHVEFKQSARWDFDRESVNRDLAHGVALTIAGLLNHAGGSLLLGVDDNGKVRGLEQDYRTLHRHDRDGYERFIMDLVRKWLGGEVCPLVHVTFHRVTERDICRVIVEPAPRPVYIDDHGTHRFVLRTGNSTRELDAREATEYSLRRFAAGTPLSAGRMPGDSLSPAVLHQPS